MLISTLDSIVTIKTELIFWEKCCHYFEIAEKNVVIVQYKYVQKNNMIFKWILATCLLFFEKADFFSILGKIACWNFFNFADFRLATLDMMLILNNGTGPK